MIRKIIHIDEAKCNGCGACAEACHEGAIAMINGKARLVRDEYCDGLGDCLPACPAGAISFTEREAAAYDRELVKANQQKEKESKEPEVLPCGCPGTKSRTIVREDCSMDIPSVNKVPSRLSQWPVQIKLVPVNAPYLENAHLLVAADCTAYAYGDFHNRFIKNRITLIGCPKLDQGSYGEKLTEILRTNNIKSLTVARMEVPCCGGIENAAKEALQNCGKLIPWQVFTITSDGKILEE